MTTDERGEITDAGDQDARPAEDTDVERTGGDGIRLPWRERDHTTMEALTGFFAGLFFVTVVPGGFIGLLRLLFRYDHASALFPLVAVALVVPVALVSNPRTRRFGAYMWLGMIMTALVVLGVTSLVLYFMVQYRT